LRADRGVVLKAVEAGGSFALEFASNQLKEDESFMASCMRRRIKWERANEPGLDRLMQISFERPRSRSIAMRLPVRQGSSEPL